MKETPESKLNDVKILGIRISLLLVAATFLIYSIIYLFKGGGAIVYFPTFLAANIGPGRAILLSFVCVAIFASCAYWCYVLSQNMRLVKRNQSSLAALALFALLTGYAKIGLLLLLFVVFILSATSEDEELFVINSRQSIKPLRAQLQDLMVWINDTFLEEVEIEEEVEVEVEVEDDSDSDEMMGDTPSEDTFISAEATKANLVENKPNFVDDVINKIEEDGVFVAAEPIIAYEPVEESPLQAESPEPTSAAQLTESAEETKSTPVHKFTSEEITVPYFDRIVREKVNLEEEVAVVELTDSPEVEVVSGVVEPTETVSQTEEAPKGREVDDTEILSVTVVPDEEVSEKPPVGQVDEMVAEPAPAEPLTNSMSLREIVAAHNAGDLSDDEFETAKRNYIQRQLKKG